MSRLLDVPPAPPAWLCPRQFLLKTNDESLLTSESDTSSSDHRYPSRRKSRREKRRATESSDSPPEHTRKASRAAASRYVKHLSQSSNSSEDSRKKETLRVPPGIDQSTRGSANRFSSSQQFSPRGLVSSVPTGKRDWASSSRDASNSHSSSYGHPPPPPLLPSQATALASTGHRSVGSTQMSSQGALPYSVPYYGLPPGPQVHPNMVAYPYAQRVASATEGSSSSSAMNPIDAALAQRSRLELEKRKEAAEKQKISADAELLRKAQKSQLVAKGRKR